MKPAKTKRTARAVWMNAALSAALAVPASVFAAHIVTRGDQAEIAHAEWVELRERARLARQLVTRGVPRSKGKRGYASYRLGMNGDTLLEGEQELFSIMAFFEIWGARAARGSVDPAKLSSYLGGAPAEWLEIFHELRDRSVCRPLDGDRYEQLLHAITGAEVLANADANQRVNVFDWQPVRLVFERVFDAGSQESVYEATIHNPNDVRSPVPGLCIEFRDDSGDRVGHWLVFPSEAAIQAGGDIEIRGRIVWPTSGRPTGIRFADDLADFYGADGLRDRFPGPGGRTRFTG